MLNAIAIIGTGYGDEGKGLMTDYFCDKHDSSICVRYNGGAQAGHTVVLPKSTHLFSSYKSGVFVPPQENIRHVFSHFGSGTFSNRPTLLASEFVVNPVLFRREREELLAKGYNPIVYVHKDCYVSTLVDMKINQQLEHTRDSKHGSVGVGFGETIERNERHVGFGLTVYDMRTTYFRQSLHHIHDNYAKTRGFTDNLVDFSDKFVDDCHYFLKNVTIVDDYTLLNEYDTAIFEGAQGLMLDQNYGMYPHVTRSNTGTKNIVTILNALSSQTVDLTVVYVNRCYTTRHGAGPLQHEMPFPDHIVDNTNHEHDYQGKLRYAPWNMTQTTDAIDWDWDWLKANISQHTTVQQEIAVTCLDQLAETHIVNIKGQLFTIPREDYNWLFVQPVTYCSYGPTRDTINKN